MQQWQRDAFIQLENSVIPEDKTRLKHHNGLVCVFFFQERTLMKKNTWGKGGDEKKLLCKGMPTDEQCWVWKDARRGF